MKPGPDLPGVGPATLVPKLKAGVDLGRLSELQLKIGPNDGFLLSRVDGRTTLGDLCSLMPFDRVETAAMVRRLIDAGAIDVPGALPPAPAPAATRAAPPPPPPSRGPGAEPPGSIDLEPDQMARIRAFHASLGERDAFQLLELPRSADKKEIKRAYFRLSKEFHPDRFYGKRLGAYGAELGAIFQAVKSAFELLSDEDRRAAYEESVPERK